MYSKLEKKLINNFPNLYMGKNMTIEQNLNCLRFECGSGWYDLIYNLSSKLEKLIIGYKAEDCNEDFYPIASQVKSKFGTLRFYMSTSTDEMENLIREAEKDSARICEFCGKDGELICQNGWYTTLCKDCVGSIQ
jgi:hypothetical protein